MVTLLSLLLLGAINGNVAQLSPSAMYHQFVNVLPISSNVRPLPSQLEAVNRVPFGNPFKENRAVSLRDPDNCARDAFIIQLASKTEDWAKRYVDSNGVKPSGFMSGNFRWLGDFDQCHNIGTIEYVTPDISLNLTSRYCRIDLVGLNNTDDRPEEIIPESGGLTLGFCATTSCEIADLPALIDPLVHDAGMKVNIMKSDCILEDVPFTVMTDVAIAIFSLMGVFVLFGLVVDLTIRLNTWYKARQHEPECDCEALLPPAVSTNDLEGDQGADVEEPPVNNEEVAIVEPPPKPIWDTLINVVLCFSPYTNFLKVVSINSPDPTEATPNLWPMNGIRALSLFWVVLGHIYTFFAILCDNYVGAAEMQKRVTIMFIYAGVFAVDTFLFLSGFFAYWSLSKQLRSLSVGSFFKSIPFIYFHRYIRLTPPLAAILLIDLGLWAHFSSGPFYFQGTDASCAKNWWTNLLYINNLVDSDHECLGWTWYLAVDTQLFLIVPFLIYLYVKKPILGWIACIEVLMIQIICNVTLTYVYNLPSTLMMRPNFPANVTDNKNYQHEFEIFYVKPYTRMAPYVIGVMCAHLAVNHSTGSFRKLFSKPWFHAIMWPVMFGTMLSLTYAQYDAVQGKYITSTFVDALYNALSKISWGVAIGWLVLACTFNSAGPIGSILSWNVWQIPARLSYVSYLLHPLIMTFYVQTSRRPLNVTDMTLVFLFFGVLFATFLVSILFTLAFESPIIGLQHLLIPSKAKKSTGRP